MKNKVDEFKQARAEFIELVNRFPEDKREEKIFDDWTLKDVLFHIARWDEALAGNLVDLKNGKEPPFYGSVQDFNGKSTELGKNLSWDNVYDKFIENGERLEEEWSSLTEDLWDKKFWPTKNSTPAKFLKINTHHYSEEHYPRLKTVFESLI